MRRVVTVVAMLGIGCGSNLGGSPSLATPEGFCRKVSSVWIDAYVRCYGGTAAQWRAFADPDSCAKLTTSGGRVQYDAAAASACIDTLTASFVAGCSVSVACVTDVLRGLVADGEPCADSYECAPRSLCRSPDDSTCAPRVCTPPAPIGATCNPWCAEGATCDSTTNTCVAANRAPIGGACGATPADVCVAGATCQFDLSMPTSGSVCRESKTGAPCFQDWDCPLEDYCDSVCTPRIPTGQPCADHPTGCKLMATCDPVASRCVGAGVIGQSCGTYSFCLTGACTGETCEGGKALGESCTDTDECASGVCQDGLCTDCAAAPQ